MNRFDNNTRLNQTARNFNLSNEIIVEFFISKGCHYYADERILFFFHTEANRTNFIMARSLGSK